MFQGIDKITSVQSTNQQHNYAAMVTFQSFGIIIAGDDADFSGKTVEAYDGTAWNTVGEFPIVVDNHSAVVIGGDSGAVYVFGGWGTTNAIDSSFLTLDGGASWIKGPALLSKRAQHRSVLVDGYVIFHLGGRNATDVGMDVEMWTFQDAAGISRTQLEWHLPNFTLYPEAFLVDYKDAQRCK